MDEEGHRQLILDRIIDYQSNGDGVHKDEAFVDTHTGIRQIKITTKGWGVCVCWKDGSID